MQHSSPNNKLFSIIGDPALSEANKVLAGLLFYILSFYHGLSFKYISFNENLVHARNAFTQACMFDCLGCHVPELNKCLSKKAQKLFLTHISNGLFLIKQRFLDMR